MENKKVQKAVALRYHAEKDQVPKVIARGAGKLAERILEVAKEHGLPVKQAQVLAETLSLLEPGEEIPESLYLAVAQIIAEVVMIDAAYKSEVKK